MSIPDNQKLDFLWKKLGYGASKTDLNSIKGATNEAIPSPLLLRGDRLWSESQEIPAIIPTVNSTYVELYLNSNAVECDMDLTSTSNRTWKTNLTDWIPPEFGSTYQVKVYIDSASSTNPTSGNQIFAAGSGNDDEWFFDYQSGILHFIGNNLPSGISGNKIYISGARYIGTFGTSGGQTQIELDSLSNQLLELEDRVNTDLDDLIQDVDRNRATINSVQYSLANFSYGGHTDSQINSLVQSQQQVGIVYNSVTEKFEPQQIASGTAGAFLQFQYSDGTRDDLNLIATFYGSEVLSSYLRFFFSDGTQDNIDMVT